MTDGKQYFLTETEEIPDSEETPYEQQGQPMSEPTINPNPPVIDQDSLSNLIKIQVASQVAAQVSLQIAEREKAIREEQSILLQREVDRIKAEYEAKLRAAMKQPEQDPTDKWKWLYDKDPAEVFSMSAEELGIPQEPVKGVEGSIYLCISQDTKAIKNNDFSFTTNGDHTVQVMLRLENTNQQALDKAMSNFITQFPTVCELEENDVRQKFIEIPFRIPSDAFQTEGDIVYNKDGVLAYHGLDPFVGREVPRKRTQPETYQPEQQDKGKKPKVNNDPQPSSASKSGRKTSLEQLEAAIQNDIIIINELGKIRVNKSKFNVIPPRPTGRGALPLYWVCVFAKTNGWLYIKDGSIRIRTNKVGKVNVQAPYKPNIESDESD